MSMLYWLTKVKEVSRMTANPLKLSYVCNYGKMGQKEIITHTKFLHKEIPIRLSQRIEDLHQLPHDLSKNKSMQEIYELYMNSFQKLHSYKTPEYWNWNDCLDYVEEVSKLKDEHIDIEFRISNAIKDYKNEIGYKNGYFDKNINDIDKILTNFYYSRIGIRFLLSQHIEILKQLDKGKEVNGIIDNKCTPYGIVNDAVSNVERICLEEYCKRPGTGYQLPKININMNKDFTMPYISRHFYYIIFEILKNSFKASMENYEGDSVITITDSLGKDDYIIKISDKGGSFNRNILDNIQSFFYTTSSQGTSLSGFGHGLGLSQIYVRYFGGDIKIIPMEGVGTDVIIYFSNFTNNSENVADDFN